MKPSALKTALLRIDERASGFPALLLVLVMLHALKPDQSAPVSAVSPCRAPMYIQVEGEVKNPGVYAFCREPNLEEVLRRAGGASGNCDVPTPVRAAALNSGRKVLVIDGGAKCEVRLEEMQAYHKVSLSTPLSVNRESREGLTAIPGIGYNLAGAIVRARESRGGFKTLEELTTVPGIGKTLYNKIRPRLAL